jgi:hypothetical protein
MHHDGRVYPSDEELVVFYEVAENDIPPLTVEAWNDGVSKGVLAWKQRYAEGIQCAYAIVKLLRSMVIRDGERKTITH